MVMRKSLGGKSDARPRPNGFAGLRTDENVFSATGAEDSLLFGLLGRYRIAETPSHRDLFRRRHAVPTDSYNFV